MTHPLAAQQGGLSQPERPDFYERTGSAVAPDGEARRLSEMARMADGISLARIAEVAKITVGETRWPSHVLDIGAGDSPSLGLFFGENDVRYTALDVRSDAIEHQQAAGNAAVEAKATTLPFEDWGVDLTHARFTDGWLSPTERYWALCERLRVGGQEHPFGSVVIDYDWSVVAGPKPLMDLVDQAVDVMGRMGFNPQYGRDLYEDMTSNLKVIAGEEALSDGTVSVLPEQKETVFTGGLSESLDLVRMHAAPLINALKSKGFDDVAEQLQIKMESLTSYAQDHPEEEVRLPDIVSTGFIVHRPEAITSEMLVSPAERIASELLREPLAEGYDYDRLFPGAEGLDSVVVAKSDRMIHLARIIQAIAYNDDRHVDPEAIDPSTGILREEIDPSELVRRSIYFASLDPKSKLGIGAVVRLVEPNGDNRTGGLPTLEKIVTDPALQQHVARHSSGLLQNPNKTVEVSALAKNPMSSDKLAMIRVVLGLAESARYRGYQYGVMGIVQKRVASIRMGFGEALTPLLPDGETLEVHGEHVNDVRLVPFAVDAQRFIGQVMAWAARESMPTDDGKVKTMLRLIANLGANALLASSPNPSEKRQAA